MDDWVNDAKEINKQKRLDADKSHEESELEQTETQQFCADMNVYLQKFITIALKCKFPTISVRGTFRRGWLLPPYVKTPGPNKFGKRYHMVVFKNGDWRDATVTQQRKPEAIPMKGHSMNSAYIDNPSGGGGNPAYAMIMHSRFEAWKKQKESAAVPVFDQFFKEAIAEYFQINGV